MAENGNRLADNDLLDLVQKQTLGYFWDFAHPVSGMIRERSNETGNCSLDIVTTGGTGFGIMALLAGASRGWLAHEQVRDRIAAIVDFLEKADRFHGAFPHFLNGATGKTIPFSSKDNGADLVETSFLIAGLLAARQYFSGTNEKEYSLRLRINRIWEEIEWNHFVHNENLYWHWSPNHEWDMGLPVKGWNEALITYVLAASSPTYPIDKTQYENGWVKSDDFRNGTQYHGIELPLGPAFGGPLFFSHYSFLGLNPAGLKDRYTDYERQNRNHALINRQHCILTPHGYKGYGPDCWGLTAGDAYNGYNAHAPDNDHGVINPTAAISSLPYTPDESIGALRYFYEELSDKIWGSYGFTDGFSIHHDWYADNYLAINQAPIVIMIENYRSGLLWNLFMRCPEVKRGLNILDFESPYLGNHPSTAPEPAGP